jgi:hypothetical protein
MLRDPKVIWIEMASYRGLFKEEEALFHYII